MGKFEKRKVECLKPVNKCHERPKISVIMPTYRRASEIGESIHTLLHGDFSDFELLVRDDGDGKDGTKEAVERISAKDSRVYYHRNQQNLRMPGNLNSGIKASRGHFIAVCHDHDLYAPNFLSSMLGMLEANPTARYVHAAISRISHDEVSQKAITQKWPELTTGSLWLRKLLENFACPVCALTMVPRSVHENYGLYDQRYGFVSDVEMWMRLCLFGDVAYVQHPIIQIRDREPDHFATGAGEKILLIVAAIHRKYLPIAFGPVRSKFQRLVLELRLAKSYFFIRIRRIIKNIK